MFDCDEGVLGLEWALGLGVLGVIVVFDHVGVRVGWSIVGGEIGMCGVGVRSEIGGRGVIIGRRRGDGEGRGSSIENRVKGGKVGGAESREIGFEG